MTTDRMIRYDKSKPVVRLVGRQYLVARSWSMNDTIIITENIKRCRLIQYFVVITKMTYRQKVRGRGKSRQEEE